MSPRLRRTAGIAGAAVILALLVWRLWPRGEASIGANTPVAAADGSVQLAASQIQALGIALGRAERASHVPLPGLLAQTQAPLGASQQVSSPWAGTVSAVLVQEGEIVQAGQPVLRLRSPEGLRAAADLARARSDAALAQRQAQRDAQLLAEGIIAAARQQQSQAQAQAAQAELARAREALTGVRASLAGHGEIELLAPISGRVLRRFVAPGDALTPQQPALQIADPDQLEIRFGVPASLRGALRPGLPLQLADGSHAQVVAIGADLDPASQQIPVRARLQTPGTHVAGERFEVTLLLPAPPAALALPRSALLPDGEAHLAYWRNGDRFHAVRIAQVLGSAGDTVVVMAPGLTPGAEVAIRGTAALKALLPTPTSSTAR